MQTENREYLKDYQTRLIEYINSDELKGGDSKKNFQRQLIVDEIKRVERYLTGKAW